MEKQLKEKEELTSYKFACIVARYLDDYKAKDISILNISNVSSMTDYFVICSSDTSTQVKALTENVRTKVKKTFSRMALRIENDLRNRWNLLDYGDVVIHILHKEERETYAIEKFWNNSFSVQKEDWMKESEEYSIYKQNNV
ncbi:ribosome silencing factor [bacterium]|nr:ribosome silencing factor [bacterium]